MNNNPIGVFDSGLGGLSVWRELKASLPGESLIYYADGKNCPYGNKSPGQIREYTSAAVDWMVRQGVKLVVVACNTATAAAIDHLRSKYSIPIVGMEPAVKPAALSTESGVVAILATAPALEGELYRRTSGLYAADVTLLPVVAEGFVELVENDLEETDQAREVVARVLEPLLAAGADRIVLGCTHYPFLSEAMRRVIGMRRATLVDPAPAIERRVEQLLRQHDIAAEPGHKPFYGFYTLAGRDYLRRVVRKSRAVEGKVF